MRIYLLVSILTISLFTFSACDKKDVPIITPPVYDTGVVTLSGNNQVISAKGSIDTLKVLVTDERGVPVSGVTVTFEQITPNEGGAFPGGWAVRTTDNNGIAFTSFYQVDTLVGIDSMLATASGLTDSIAYFTYQVIPRTLDSLVLMIDSGDEQFVTAGATATPCVVHLTDKFSNSIPNHQIRFVAEDRCLVTTDSSTNPLTESDTAITRTDAAGLASAIWTLTVNPLPSFDIYPNASRLRVLNEQGDTISFRAQTIDPSPIDYFNDIRPIFEANCFVCHTDPPPPTEVTTYFLDTYFETFDPAIIFPGDSTSPLLTYAIPSHEATQINVVEEDFVRQWIIQDSAMSGPITYDIELDVLLDVKCGSFGLCHADPLYQANYSTESYADILDSGLDGTPNAIAGDSSCLLVQKLLPSGSMYLHVLPDTATIPKMIIKWVIEDSLREN